MNLLITFIVAGFTFFQSDLPQTEHKNSIQQTQEGKEIPPPSNCIASPDPLVVNQPNGTSLTIVGKGNMNNSWTETIDGYTVVLNQNGIYEYAQKVNGELILSGIKANNPVNRNLNETNFLASTQQSLQGNPDPLKSAVLNQVRAGIQNKTYPTTGTINVLALLIDYPDLAHIFPKDNFDSLLYANNYRGGDGSFKTYYETSSNGQLTINVDVRGWFTANNNFLYYGRDSGYDKAADLVREAVDAAELAGVDFSNYDNDNDGDVDGILAVHSGQGAEQGSQTQFIWSHRWVLNGGNLGSVTYDGVFINDYMMNPETRVSGPNQNMVGIGVFCHEFGHNLGLPDLYDTDDSNGDSRGLGTWCLMSGGSWAGGEHLPTNFSAWCKEENGWVTPTQLTIGNSSSHTLDPASTNINEIYRINTNLPNEYFLLENRQQVGLDQSISGEGLAIWHINTNKTNAPGNSVNGDENLKGVDLEEADGLNDLDNEVNSGDAGDLFPGTSNNTRFDDNSNPSALTYTLATTNLIIQNISESGNQVNFDFGSPGSPSCSGNTTLTANSGTFDDGSPAAANYNDNLNCSWLIQPAGASSITLNFTRFDVDNTIDRVAVYDGNSFSAPLIGTYTGSTIPSTINSSGGSLFVEFITNGSVTSTGWEANWISTPSSTPCSGTTTLTSASGTFSDGSGTSNYTNNLNCSWLIQPTGASTITFGLNSLATEISTDWIRVYDGTNSSAPILGSYSGTNNLNTITSTGGDMFVEFTTNGSGTDAGWDAFYTSSTAGPGCSGNTNLTASNGTFTDGSGPNNYDNNQFCTWLIQPTASPSSITLSFSSFNTESSSDRVIIYDGIDASAPQLASYSGSSIPANVSSSGGVMFVEFRTNGTITDQGWNASYTSTFSGTCSGLTTLTAASGSFDDGSGTSNYSNNLNCSWLIQPTGSPLAITLDVNNMNLIGFSDRLRVYDGTDNTGTLIGNFFFTFSNSVTAYSGSMYLEFVTDGSNTSQGWDVSYSSSSSYCQSLTTLTGNFGNFDDGSPFGQTYANNSDCSWLIQPTNPNLAIELNIFSLNTQLGNDTITVYDGSANTDPILGTFSGNNAPSNNVTSSGNSMLVTFKSNASVTGQGWRANYNTQPIPACSGQTILTSASGTFDDGSGNGNQYIQNSNCTWLIQPTGAVSIDLSFNYFSTEQNFDFVRVYDGPTTSSTLLGSYSGRNVPPNLIGGSSMLVEFNSDAGVQDNGFEVNYTSSNVVNLAIVEDTVYINSGIGNSTSIDVTSNTSWTITESSPWLISTTINGNRDQTVNLLTTQPNIGPPRSTMVYANNSASATTDSVLVIQRGSGNYMSANPDTLFFPGNGGTQKFEIISNVNWNVNIPLGPGTANPTSGNGDDSITVTLPANTSQNVLVYIAVINNSAPNTNNDTVFLVHDTIPSTTPSLSVSPSNLTLNQASGSSGNFTVNSTVVWQTSTPASWITINNPANTSDTNTVQIVANTMNMSASNRDSYVAVQNTAGTLFDTVFVTQLGGNVFLSANPTNINLAQAANSSASSALTANLSWTATSSDPSWLDVNPSSGNANTTLNINALTANNASSPRSGFIAIASTNGSLVDTIFVSQDGLPPQLSVSPKSISVAQPNGSFGNFQVNSNVSWQTSGGASWITVLNPAVTMDTNMVQVITNSANTNPNPRSTYVAVSDVNNTLFDTVLVTQTGTNPTLSGSPDTVTLASSVGATATINLTSNLSWLANEGATWFDADQTSGTGNATITLSALSNNTTGASRISIIDFAEQGGGLTDTVVVIQEIAPTIPTTSPDTIRLNAAANSTASFSINAPTQGFAWVTNPVDNWLSLSQNSGTGDVSIIATANSANTSQNERLTYVLTTTSSLPIGIDTLVVIQEGVASQLAVSPSSVNLNFASGSNDVLNVVSNLSWTVTNAATWLSINPTSATGDNSVTVTANSDNLSGSSRSTTLTFSATGVQDQLVTVTQIDGTTPSFDLSKDTVFVNNPQGSTGTFSVLANAVNWSLSENTSWLLINPTSGNNTQTITALAASRNVFGNPRYADITATANGYPDQTVTVVQEESTPLFQVSPSMLIIGSDLGDFMDFNISSNLISWKVVENSNWMTVSPDSGAFTSQIRVTATEDNRSGNVRTDIISVEAPPLVPRNIMITQDTVRTIGIAEETAWDQATVLYPNPTDEELNIEFPKTLNAAEIQLAVYNNLGAKVNLTKSITSFNKVRFNVSSLPAGFYFVTIEYEGKVATKKISIIN